MGYNTTVVVYNDALDSIRKDPEFGRKLEQAIIELPGASRRNRDGRNGVDIPSGPHVNAAMVVETHHADETALVTVGGNLGICHLTSHYWDHHTPEGQVRLLRKWADALGYRLVRKSSK